MKYQYRILNVFTRNGAILSGNPLCVFEDARGLTQAQMQALAQQLNLSETTFVFPAPNQPRAADATVRIFTPAFEMPFAGHPTLGTAHVVADLLRKESLTFEMHAGLIAVSASGNRHWRLKTAGQRKVLAADFTDCQYASMLQLPVEKVAGAAGPIRWVNTGSDQLIIPLADADAVAAAQPIPALLMEYGKTAARAEPIAYVWAYQSAATTTQVVARLFFGSHGAVVEDPATGSACANLGGWLLDQRDCLRSVPLQITVSQGDAIGRPSTLHLEIDEHDSIFVSGEVIELGRGWFEL